METNKTEEKNIQHKPHSAPKKHGEGGPKKHSRGRSKRINLRRPMKRPAMRNIVSEEKITLPPLEDKIRVIPLGGVEEIGRNMTAIEYKDDIIVVDAGIQFSNDETPGIDYVLPNIKYLEKNKGKIRALVITHGHLDHIGGIPFVIEQLGNPPIYTREFGAMIIRKRQEEFPQLAPLNLVVAEAEDGPITISDNLKIRFFGLTHSIPDSTGIIIETPLGDIVNTGDVRVDNIENIPTAKEVEQYSIFKDRNILLLTMDSTGIATPGWSLSESVVMENIDEIIKEVPGRVIIATFASQIDRIIGFIEIAKKYNKKIVVEGRSMKNNVGIIKHLELTDMSHVIPIDDISKYPPNKIVGLVTGAQGEQFAALMRISNKSHKHINLNTTDTIILSSSVIPGNEVQIQRLKDNLYRTDARIITYTDSNVHTSGHGKRGELEWIHTQIPYKFFMPVHGHHFMLKMHAELSHKLGTPKENIVVADNGNVIEISGDGSKIEKIKEKVPSGKLVVDGFSISDIQEAVLRDRKALAEEGIFVIVASINTRTGKLKKSPDIISRGFVYLRESQDLLQQARTVIKKAIEESITEKRPIDFNVIKDNVNNQVTRFLFQKTAKKPIVIPVVLGV
jgi:ribonuclease J